MRNRRRLRPVEAELDITSFMNLMIILVPVLLMSMVFSHITVLDLKLPEASGEASSAGENQQLELLVRGDHIDVNFPAGTLLKRVPRSDHSHDYTLLSSVLQEVKRRLRDRDVDKRDIVVLAEAQTDYQTLIAVMDTVRSFDAVVAASLVQAELFPQIVLGEAPPRDDLIAAGGQG